MKKLLSVLLVMLIVTSTFVFAIPATTASAATDGYYTYTVSDGEATITDVDTSISGDVTIPSTLGGYPVTYIGNNAFYNCISLSNVAIPNGVKNIGFYAFYNCASLRNIVIPDSVTNICDYAFMHCTALTSITIPVNVKSINYAVFADCISLRSVFFGDNVTTIDYYAFQNCLSLTRVNIPDSVTNIEITAFLSCTSLTDIFVSENNKNYYSEEGVLFNKNKTEVICCGGGKTGSIIIPSSIKSIASMAFYNCTGITKITIPNSVTSIGDRAFYNCTSLLNINIPDRVTNIKHETFAGCRSLTSISVPNSVTIIEDAAFLDCSSLTNIVIPDSVTEIGWEAFQNCTSLEGVVIGNGVVNLGWYAFLGCTSLKTVNIPDSIANIDWFMFSGCESLISITIPDSVTSIGASAFYDCDSLETVYYYGTQEQWDRIIVEVGNECLTNAHIVFLSETKYQPITAEIENIADNMLISNAWVKRFDNHFSGRYALHTTTGGKVQFSFYGTQFGIVSYKSPSQGKMYISIDGGEEIEVSLYDEKADTYFKETVYTSDELDAATHTVTLRVEGKAVLDALNITGEIEKCETPIKDNVRIEVENILNAAYTGNWSKVYAWKLSAHNAMKSSNGTVTFDFEGDMLSIISYKAKTQGKLYVSIDGNDEIEVDLYDDSTDKLYQEKVFTEYLDYGNHTVTIRTSGAAIIDAIEINRNSAETVTYEAEDKQFELTGSWKAVETWSLSNHKALQGSNGASVSFSYTGYDFKVISYKAKTQGKMYISIDGAAPIEVDLYDASTDTKYKEIALDAAGLDYGTHTVTITTSGKVILDAIKIDGTLN